MGLKQTQSLAPRQRQGLALSPAPRQALALLRLDSADLVEEIRRELARNPFLRCDWPTSAPLAQVPLESVVAKPSIYEDLQRQIGLMRLAPEVRVLALRLLHWVRADGYLDDEASEALRAEGVAKDAIDAAIEALQSCDPPGVGARNLHECLELQLRELGISDPAATVVALRALVAGDLHQAAADMRVSLAEAGRRAQVLHLLRPHPVDPLADSASEACAMHPDLRLREGPDGRLSVEAGKGILPKVRLDQMMVRRARADGFALDQLQRAESLIAALRYRGDTLRRIGRALLEHQHGFLANGPAGLRPLTQRALAAELGLHPSTVSRAVAGKSIEFRGRIWPLSALFSRALPTNTGGVVAAGAVRARIAAMIDEERSGRPLSDVALARRLCAEGVDIARRTVAKYREEMRIPASSRRRCWQKRSDQPQCTRNADIYPGAGTGPAQPGR